jgi:hypothetical protein
MLSVRDQVSNLYNNISHSHTSGAIQKRAPTNLTFIMVLQSTSRLLSGQSSGSQPLPFTPIQITLCSPAHSQTPHQLSTHSIHTNVVGNIQIINSASSMSFLLDELGQKETET